MMAFRSFLPNSLARGRLPGKERSRRKGVKNERAKKSQAMGTCHPLSAFCLVSSTPTTDLVRACGDFPDGAARSLDL